jgi:hypothetical protein
MNAKGIIGRGIKTLDYLALFVTILIGTMCSFVGFEPALSWDRQKIKTEYKKGEEICLETIKREIQSNLHALVSLKAFFDSTRGC